MKVESESWQTSVTQWLQRARAGEAHALDAAFSAVYEELKRAAHLQLRRGRNTINTTGLVHEAWMKLAISNGLSVVDRNHLLALSARAMRQVLVDRARIAQARKRGDGLQAVTLTASIGMGAESVAAVEVLALDQMLDTLQKFDQRAAQIVELRYFGGYEEKEIAQMLQINERTVRATGARPGLPVDGDAGMSTAPMTRADVRCPSSMSWPTAGAERERRVEELCAGDEGLRAQVRALLEADARTDELFNGNALRWGSALGDAETTPHDDRRTGATSARGHIVSVIGHGGMARCMPSRATTAPIRKRPR